MLSLDKIFGLYTLSFLSITVLIGIGERIGWFSNQMIPRHLRRDRGPHPHLQP
jgi:hypothetical protein